MPALAAVALRNRLLAIDASLVVKLKNVRVNGALFGCSGCVTDPRTGRVVYVNTDHNHGTRWDNALYRRAKDDRDFTGGTNHTASYADLPQQVVALLRNI